MDPTSVTPEPLIGVLLKAKEWAHLRRCLKNALRAYEVVVVGYFNPSEPPVPLAGLESLEEPFEEE